MTVCLFAGTPSPYLDRPIGGVSCLDRVQTFVGSLDGVTGVTVFGVHEVNGFPREWHQIQQPSWSVASLVDAIAQLVTGPDDVVMFARIDQPFLNVELTKRLLDRHGRFHADYTFADGYPAGLAPELLRGRCLSYLRELSVQVDGPVRPGSLFSVIQKDMNRFDIETELNSRDQRMLRLALSVDTRANLRVCESLAEGEPANIDDWPDHVVASPAVHRSLPRYVSVQVLEQDVHEVTYSPYPGVFGHVLAPGAIMSTARFTELVGAVHRLSPEAIISMSLWGEISLHPDVPGLISAVTSRAPLGLVVETSGIGWRQSDREHLFSQENVTVIVGLDTNDRLLYRDVRGEGFAEAVDFAQAAVAALPETAYVQAVRCDLTEPTLDAFYKHWSETTANIIIQKYDSFSGRLPQRAVSDLAPLKRFPCWHLQRDLSILVDGTVPLCREDIDKERSLGNVFDDGLESVWERGAAEYRDHVNEKYVGVCERCDEYYTFNF